MQKRVEMTGIDNRLHFNNYVLIILFSLRSLLKSVCWLRKIHYRRMKMERDWPSSTVWLQKQISRSVAHCKLLFLLYLSNQKIWLFASISFDVLSHFNSYCGKIFRDSSEQYGTHVFECPSEVRVCCVFISSGKPISSFSVMGAQGNRCEICVTQ